MVIFSKLLWSLFPELSVISRTKMLLRPSAASVLFVLKIERELSTVYSCKWVIYRLESSVLLPLHFSICTVCPRAMRDFVLVSFATAAFLRNFGDAFKAVEPSDDDIGWWTPTSDDWVDESKARAVKFKAFEQKGMTFEVAMKTCNNSGAKIALGSDLAWLPVLEKVPREKYFVQIDADWYPWSARCQIMDFLKFILYFNACSMTADHVLCEKPITS
ncbi:hypothetical protein Q1695_002632 [Nippostrongylus brasiliensis]|nr:hypothetical protein Q1695_002632 [Nippostrongylus brasiliensis]